MPTLYTSKITLSLLSLQGALFLFTSSPLSTMTMLALVTNPYPPDILFVTFVSTTFCRIDRSINPKRSISDFQRKWKRRVFTFDEWQMFLIFFYNFLSFPRRLDLTTISRPIDRTSSGQHLLTFQQVLWDIVTDSILPIVFCSNILLFFLLPSSFSSSFRIIRSKTRGWVAQHTQSNCGSNRRFRQS